jgi:hypothetical protein
VRVREQRARSFVQRSIAAASARLVPVWCTENGVFRRQALALDFNTVEFVQSSSHHSIADLHAWKYR